ncbi:flavin reductase family protein [Streptosporangium amethystogenes]|uniref:flavin reductase family protein n=1 Tax=Streptosporangium amethystogenes TaxID=2002 RepID=UPI0007C81693|nr:flavin reductase family protein [Streptosporangium amethystogenes]
MADDSDHLTWTRPLGSAAELKRIFAGVPAPVAALCATVDGENVSFVASSFVPVSLDPPLVSVCVRTGSTTWARLRGCGRLGISVLERAQSHIARRLASHAPDKFTGIDLSAEASGEVFVVGAAVTMTCSIAGTAPAGDHEIVFLLIERAQACAEAEPVVFHGSRFRSLSREPLAHAEWWPLTEWQ